MALFLGSVSLKGPTVWKGEVLMNPVLVVTFTFESVC